MMGRTPREQAARIAELLQFAHVDDMSADDRAVCRQQLARLYQQMDRTSQGIAR